MLLVCSQEQSCEAHAAHPSWTHTSDPGARQGTHPDSQDPSPACLRVMAGSSFTASSLGLEQEKVGRLLLKGAADSETSGGPCLSRKAAEAHSKVFRAWMQI